MSSGRSRGSLKAVKLEENFQPRQVSVLTLKYGLALP